MAQRGAKLVTTVLFLAVLGAMLSLPGEAKSREQPSQAKLEVTFYYLPG